MASTRKRIIILGATGSIGDSCFRVIRAARDAFEVIGISAGSNSKKLAALAQEFSPKALAIHNAATPSDIPAGSTLYQGEEACLKLLDHECDIVVAAITGAAGLLPIMKALEQGRTVALANKEALVCAGSLMMQAAKRHGATLLPVDSEHNAVFQALAGQDGKSLSHITLTASGGPFLHTPLEQLSAVTPEQAVAHPKWNMGAKISVDSATMMNKGLELIEAHWLFGLPSEQIDVAVHPQAVIHGMAHFSDGSVLAQMGEPDMAIPLSYCLHWPQRGPSSAKSLSLTDYAKLEFLPVDTKRFPALALARQALKQGQAATIALNAANEIAVDAFLNHRISFNDIVPLVAQMTEHAGTRSIDTVSDIMEWDAEIRTLTQTELSGRMKRYA